MTDPAANGTLLSVEGLAVQFHTPEGVARAVDGVSFRVEPRETFCLVGESGCGKSVTALSIMRLVPTPPGRIASGRVVFKGRDLLALPARRMREVRGNNISMIFQEPMTALNPVFTIGNQLTEAVRLHRRVSRAEARRIAVEMLERVRIPDAGARMGQYPHEMSGGMLQRAMIAMALICRPALLIADEPTTALDVTLPAQRLALLNELQAELGMSVLLITHDLGVVAQVANWVGVMYAGRIVEYGDVESIFHDPMHPYLISLFRSLPTLGKVGQRLNVIPGRVPDPRRHPSGCRFHPRCYMAVPACARVEPELQEVEPGHQAACIRLKGYRLPAGVDVEPADPLAMAEETYG
jgi:oligopeptide/dipeptide ABC transporter ATP-binding protein